MAVELENLLKQAAIMENKPGGMFCIRMRSLMSSPGDGQTLIYFYNGLASVQAVRQRFDIKGLSPPALSCAAAFSDRYTGENGVSPP